METLYRALGKSPPDALPPIAITSVQLVPARCGPGALYIPVQEFRPPALEANAIEAAIRNGAVAAFTNLQSWPHRPPAPIIHAGATVRVLAALAKHARSEYRGKVVAITGSVGKTTTKDLTHHVLSSAGPAFRTFGNLNKLSAILQAMINRPLDSRFSVVEVAATRPGHLYKAHFVRPHVGVVTNVGVTHLQNFKSAADLFREKLSLFDHLEGERIGIVHRSVLDADDAHERLLASKQLSRLLTVGGDKDDDVRLEDAEFDGAASSGTMSILGVRHRFRLPLPAPHFVDNAMFAMAVAAALELDVETLIEALATTAPTDRRFQRYHVAIEGGAIELIDDAYNAAPASVAAMLDALAKRSAPGRKILVLGDMLELGNDSARLHEDIAPLVENAGVDLLVTVGELARRAAAATLATASFPDAAATAAAVPSLLMPGDLVAVKGSNDVGLAKVVAAIQAIGVSEPAMAWRIEEEGPG
jgi:UDP-N-acetylmuramoyl-tripeptide--D-alanyl-D-alanine ligase